MNCGYVSPQEKVVPLALRIGQWKKIHISICGHPTSSTSLLLVVTLSMTMLGHSLPGGASCPDFPSLYPLGPSGPAMPGLHPCVPCVGSQSSSLGISCHCGSVPGLCFCQITSPPPPRQCPGSFPGPQVESLGVQRCGQS